MRWRPRIEITDFYHVVNRGVERRVVCDIVWKKRGHLTPNP